MQAFGHMGLFALSTVCPIEFEKNRGPGLDRDEVCFQAPERAELFAHSIVCLIEF
jgi:hypothetical protein